MVEDNLGKALYAFSHFDSKTGDTLGSNYFLGIGRLRNWGTTDLQDGIDQARRRGFVEEGIAGWRLTAAGFEAIANVAAQ